MNLSSVDLNLLPVFEALLEERSVSRAAKRVGLSQPALSNALARLRLAIGDPLFIREGRTMRPSPRALEMGTAVRGGLHQLKHALEGEPRFDPTTSTRLFRIAMSDSTEWLISGKFLSAVTAASRGVRVQVRRLDGLFTVPESDLRVGALDLAVGYFPDARGLEAGTSVETLHQEENVVILRRRHAALRGKWSLEKFASLDHAAIIYRSEPWGLIDTELASRGLQRKLRMASPHFLPVAKAVAGADLIAVVPEDLARSLKASLHLELRPVPLALPPFVTRMVWRQHGSEDPATEWMRGLVRSALVHALPRGRGNGGAVV